MTAHGRRIPGGPRGPSELSGGAVGWETIRCFEICCGEVLREHLGWSCSCLRPGDAASKALGLGAPALLSAPLCRKGTVSNLQFWRLCSHFYSCRILLIIIK